MKQTEFQVTSTCNLLKARENRAYKVQLVLVLPLIG